MEYSIGEFSRLTNLGIHTLRYYEHENLTTPKRNSSNRRCYSDKDLVQRCNNFEVISAWCPCQDKTEEGGDAGSIVD